MNWFDLPKLRALFVTVVILFTSIQMSAQEEKEGYWNNGIYHSSWAVALPSEDRSKMKQIWEEIGQDLKTNNDSYGGTFYMYGRSGYFLRWSSNKGFIFIPYYDENLIIDFSYGTVTQFDSEIMFDIKRDLTSDSRIAKKTPKTWLVSRNQIFPAERIKDYGLYKAGLGKYNEFNGLCCEFTPAMIGRKIDGRLKSNGIPEKYQKYLLRPIEGELIWIGKSRKFKELWFGGSLSGYLMENVMRYPIRLNKGSLHGVKRRMLFEISYTYKGPEFVEITNVKKTMSTGYLYRMLSDSGKEVGYDDTPLPKIEKGQKISTAQ